jgi:hypothetical protein
MTDAYLLPLDQYCGFQDDCRSTAVFKTIVVVSKKQAVVNSSGNNAKTCLVLSMHAVRSSEAPVGTTCAVALHFH